MKVYLHLFLFIAIVAIGPISLAGAKDCSQVTAQLQDAEKKEIMRIHLDTSIQEFLKHAEPLLLKNEAANSLILGMIQDLASGSSNFNQSAPLLIRVSEGEQVVAVAFQVEPFYLALTSANPEQLQALAQYLHERGLSFPGIAAPPLEAEIFSQAWCALARCRARVAMDQQIYQLNKVVWPPPHTGFLQQANASHREVLSHWLMDFNNEILPPHEHLKFEQSAQMVDRAIEQQAIYLWWVNGKPVAMASISRSTPNSISIGRVYAPPAERKQGYASALVAHLSQEMLNSGKRFCVLYADSKNPRSNRIYQNIGYEPLAEAKLILFE